MLSFFSKILKYVWPQIRKYKWVFCCILVGFSLRIFFAEIITPLYFKKIVDIFSLGIGDNSTTSNEIFQLFVIIVAIHILVFFIARFTKFIFLKFEIDVIRDLRNFAFQKIEQNSPTFFSNTFAGSLVTKARRFVTGFEIAFDIFVYNFLKFFVILVGVFTVLLYQSPMISLVFGIWIVIHISVVSFFVKKKMTYDLLEAEQDSKISGRLSDVFSNILAVKFFLNIFEINFFTKKKKKNKFKKEKQKRGKKKKKKPLFLGF